MLNSSIHFSGSQLNCDSIPIHGIVREVDTPVYIYSLKRALGNYSRIANAFASLNADIHYSAKANSSLAILRALVSCGAGIDCVSGGEVYRALKAGCPPERIVFAGVGKTVSELAFAIDQSVGWINIENEAECALINDLAQERGCKIQVALRYNPDILAKTIGKIATGHKGAKFGLSADAVRHILETQADYPALRFSGLHVHVGSQLGDTTATSQAVQSAIALIAQFPQIRTLDIGGGIPTAYSTEQSLPSVEDFAHALQPLLTGYNVIIEPGRSIIADAGILVAKVLYIKEHGGKRFVILDTGMTELIRPALYEAHHAIIPIRLHSEDLQPAEVVGPVCETTDYLAHECMLPPLSAGEHVAILTAGAYGFVMASNYNARPRPPEVIVSEDGSSWQVTRRRETWEDLAMAEG